MIGEGILVSVLPVREVLPEDGISFGGGSSSGEKPPPFWVGNKPLDVICHG